MGVGVSDRRSPLQHCFILTGEILAESAGTSRLGETGNNAGHQRSATSTAEREKLISLYTLQLTTAISRIPTAKE